MRATHPLLAEALAARGRTWGKPPAPSNTIETHGSPAAKRTGYWPDGVPRPERPRWYVGLVARGTTHRKDD